MSFYGNGGGDYGRRDDYGSRRGGGYGGGGGGFGGDRMGALGANLHKLDWDLSKCVRTSNVEECLSAFLIMRT